MHGLWTYEISIQRDFRSQPFGIIICQTSCPTLIRFIVVLPEINCFTEYQAVLFRNGNTLLYRFDHSLDLGHWMMMTGVIWLSIDKICVVSAHGSDPCGEPTTKIFLLLSKDSILTVYSKFWLCRQTLEEWMVRCHHVIYFESLPDTQWWS